MTRLYDWEHEQEQRQSVTLPLPVAKAIKNMLKMAKPYLPSQVAVDEAIQLLEVRGEDVRKLAPSAASPRITPEEEA